MNKPFSSGGDPRYNQQKRGSQTSTRSPLPAGGSGATWPPVTPPKPSPIPRFKVQQMRLVSERGNLRAFCDVLIGGRLLIRDLRIIQEPGKSAFLSPPQRTWTDGTGKNRYTPIVAWPPEWQEPITQAALTAWQQEVAAEGVGQ